MHARIHPTLRWLAPFALAALAASASAQQPITMRIAHAMPTTHGYHLWAEKFRDDLKALVGNRVDVKIFPNAQLGKETEYIEGLKLGTIDGTIFGRHGQIDPRLDVLNLPMIYRDDAHVDAVLRRNLPVQQRLEQIMYDKGVKVLGWGELGFRHVTTKSTPVHKAADLKGVDIRIPTVDPWIIAFKAWGANPTPIDFAEALLRAAAGCGQGAGESTRDHLHVQALRGAEVPQPHLAREHPVADGPLACLLGEAAQGHPGSGHEGGRVESRLPGQEHP